MRIVILTSEYISEEESWHGGLSNYLSRICSGLVRRGHVVHLLTYSMSPGIIESDGINIHRIPINNKLLIAMNMITYRLFRDILYIFFIAFAIRSYLYKTFKKGDLDIIHCSSCSAPGLFVNQRKLGVPMVLRLSSITRLAEIADGRRNYLDMWLLNWAEKRLAKKSDRVFAPSQATVKNAKQDFGMNIDLIEPPGYLGFLSNNKWDHTVYNHYYSGKKYILFYGTLSRLKGAMFLSRVVPLFLDQFKDYYFVIIGKTAPLNRCDSSLEPLLNNASKFRERIIYTNSLRHQQLMPIIQGAQAVVIPSIIDNFPNTMIEAMSMSKVVIGTWDAGMDQLIEDGVNGYLVHYGDEAGFLKVLKQICAGDQRKLTKIGENALLTVKKRLNFEARIIDLENYYQEAIQNFKNRKKGI